MKLEFHQLNRRYEHLRVQRADEQRRLMASLAASGQQTPIVVVAISGTPDSYLVIDGYKRIAALEHLGKDRVEAVIWPMSESEALVLDCSMRLGQRHTALEEGWRLQELRDRFGPIPPAVELLCGPSQGPFEVECWHHTHDERPSVLRIRMKLPFRKAREFLTTLIQILHRETNNLQHD